MTRQTDDLLVIDADAHILEPPDLWQRYLDPAFCDRPICIKTDDLGLEYLEIDGKMSKRNSGGMLFTVGGYGKSQQELRPRPDRTYAGTAPLGAMDPKERIAEQLSRGTTYLLGRTALAAVPGEGSLEGVCHAGRLARRGGVLGC